MPEAEQDDGMAAGRERGVLVPRLRDWRQRRALTQRQLAALADVAPTTIDRAERLGQRVETTTLGRLARALGVDPQELMAPPPG
jgi:transcriptional regulator with XRE-family HTH domain